MFFILVIGSKFNMLLDLELLLLLVYLVGIVEGYELNLLFIRKSLNSPLNEFSSNLGCRADTIETFEVLLINSFGSTCRVVENRFDKERIGLELKDRGNRSFRDKKVERRRSTLDKLLDRDESSLCDLWGKEGSYDVVNSFFKTKDKYGRVELDLTNKLIKVIVAWDNF